MDPISGISARVSAIESRVRSAPSPSSGQFADLLRAEIAQRTTGNAVLGYSASGLTPGADQPSGTGARSLLPASAFVPPTGSTLTPAERKAPGEYGSLTPPAALVGFGNGTIPPEALTTLSVEGHSLYAPAGNAFEAMFAAATRDGVTIGVTDSYRPLAVQERLATEKGLYSDGGLAATPGYSNHGWGMSLDLDLDEQAQAWMRENGPDYGFVEDVPREPWHWTYRPLQSQ